LHGCRHPPSFGGVFQSAAAHPRPGEVD
jgi:hypothetical protein